MAAFDTLEVVAVPFRGTFVEVDYHRYSLGMVSKRVVKNHHQYFHREEAYMGVASYKEEDCKGEELIVSLHLQHRPSYLMAGALLQFYPNTCIMLHLLQQRAYKQCFSLLQFRPVSKFFRLLLEF